MHGIAGGIIFFAVIVTLMDVAAMKEREFYMKFALVFLACSVFQVVSFMIKDDIVHK